MSIKKKQNELVTEFNSLKNWEDRYERLIEFGKNLKTFDKKLKTDERIIKGCQSRVWIDVSFYDGKLFFNADSDGILPKGIIAIFVYIFSGESVIDIINTPIDFIEKIGFHEFLSPSRANGMLAMIKQIKFFAFAYQSKYTNH